MSNTLPRPFLTLWIGQVVSEVGSLLTGVAAAVYVFLETGSAFWLGTLTAVSAAPALLVAGFAPWIDRRSRRSVMLLADTVAAVGPATLLLLAVGGRLEIWHLLVGGAISGFGTALQMVASQAALPSLVPRDQLDRANGLRQLGPAVAIVLGPALATPLLVHGGLEAVFVVDLASFAVGIGALLLSGFRDAAPEPATDDGSWRSAWTWLHTSDPMLLWLMGATAVVNLAFAVFNVALLATGTEVVGPARVGLVLSVAGLAMIVGSIDAGRRGLHPDRIRTLCLGLGAAMVGCLIAAARPSGIALGFGCIVALGFVPKVNAAMATIYNDRVPPRMQGRVFALRGAISQILQPVGALLAGVLIVRVAEPSLDSPFVGGVFRTVVGGADRGSALTLAAVGLVLGIAALTIAVSPLRRALRATPGLHM